MSITHDPGSTLTPICDTPEELSQETTLRASEARYQTLFQYAEVGVVLADWESRCIDVNPKACRMFGYSREEFIGLHVSDLVAETEIRNVGMALGQIADRSDHHREWQLRRKDGSVFPADVVATRMPDETLLGVVTDISERRHAEDRLAESEQNYRELVEFSNTIIVRWKADGHITFLNDFGQRFFGYSADEIVGQHVIGTIVPPRESSGRDLAKLMEFIRANPAAFEQNINENIRRNGQRVWISWTNRIVRDPQGQVVEFVSFGSDITERKKLEDQLRQSQKMEAIGRLAGGIAHDFNNLLTIISGYSEVLLAIPEMAANVRESVKAISEAGARAASLTRRLLGFSRQTILHPQILDLNAVITDMGKMLRRLIGEDIVFTTVLDPNLSRVRVDPSHLDQILMNLAVNARDAMPKGGALTIETANVQLGEEHAVTYAGCRTGQHVMLAITDTGHGMTPAVMERIFEPFFTTKEVGKGTGLGLAMVFGIVQQSGGCIHVFSEPGAGTIFRIYFPVAAAQAAIKNDPASHAGARGTETVLLVEDEEAVRALALLSLQIHGYKVIPAKDGNDAVRIMQTRRGSLDMVLTDVVMPDISGPALVERLRGQFPQMKVLFMSGYADDAMVRHGLQKDGVSFIQKPYTPLELARKVRQVLDEK
jgi:PAS domain S-box-containing protein